MQQRLTEAAAICYRHCQEDLCDFGISVSSVCMGEDGIRQAYQQAREMMKLHFYEKKRSFILKGGRKRTVFCRKVLRSWKSRFPS